MSHALVKSSVSKGREEDECIAALRLQCASGEGKGSRVGKCGVSGRGVGESGAGLRCSEWQPHLHCKAVEGGVVEVGSTTLGGTEGVQVRHYLHQPLAARLCVEGNRSGSSAQQSDMSPLGSLAAWHM